MTESAWHVPCGASKEAEIGMGLDGCMARGPSGSQESASPSRPRTNTDNLAHKRSSRDKWSVAAAILPGQLTIAFGMFGVVVALPNIITAFGTDVQTVQWVMTGYLVARVIPISSDMPTDRRIGASCTAERISGIKHFLGRHGQCWDNHGELIISHHQDLLFCTRAPVYCASNVSRVFFRIFLIVE
jgi:hypothetical protein